MTTVKNILISVVVAAVVAFGVATVTVSTTTGQNLGASANEVQQTIWQFTKGISIEGQTRTGRSPSAIISASGSVVAGQSLDYWTNKTGRTIYFDYGEAYTTGGFASSSMMLSMFATSTTPASVASTFAYTQVKNSTTTMSNLLLDNILVPTSTPPGYLWNSDTNAGTTATGTVAVPDGQSLFVFIRQNSINNCTGASCEAASSTARGFNLDWYAQGHYRP